MIIKQLISLIILFIIGTLMLALSYNLTPTHIIYSIINFIVGTFCIFCCYCIGFTIYQQNKDRLNEFFLNEK